MQHAVGTRHGDNFGQFGKDSLLDVVDAGALLVGEMPVELLLEQAAYGAAARPAFVEVELVAGTADAHGREGAIPGLDVIFHRVVEHAVHVDEGGLGVDARGVMFDQVVLDSFNFAHLLSVVCLYKNRVFEIICQRGNL